MDISKWFHILFFTLFSERLCEDIVTLRIHTERVVGGEATKIQYHPYYAFVNSGCGGSIIGKRWILTAGHCKTLAMTTVFVGDWIPYEIQSAIRMPLFYKAQGVSHYDYMLLRLNKSLDYGPNVQPIQFGKKRDIVKGQLGTALGYGYTSENGTEFSMNLRKVELPILERQTCRRVHLALGMRVEANEFCAGYPRGGKDTCKGDSGGPFVVNGRLLGITSYGNGCARRRNPGVYGSVPYALPWIRRVTGIK